MSGELPALHLDPRPALLEDTGLRAVLAALGAGKARVVGGAVRDLLVERAVTDIDIATVMPPGEVLAALARAGIKAVPTGIAHGTVTAVLHGRPFEITTLRHDVETDGRHAVVKWTGDWRADAARRDFTINALSLDADGNVFDYFGGIGDLREGKVRFVGEAGARIAEDYLRILRFFRFFARYGTGVPDAAALAAIAAHVGGLARLSVERVWSELKRILSAPDPRSAVALMQRTGVLDSVLPEGADPARLASLVAAGAPEDPVLRLAALLDGDVWALAVRLKFSRDEAVMLAMLRAGPVPRAGDDDAQLRRLLADDAKPVLIGRSWLAGEPASVRERLAAMSVPVFPVQGKDVLECGVPAGPRVGTILRQVREKWLQSGCTLPEAKLRAEITQAAYNT